MEIRKTIQPNSALLARLHAACRPDAGAMSKQSSDADELPNEKQYGPLGRSTLVSSLQRRLEKA